MALPFKCHYYPHFTNEKRKLWLGYGAKWLSGISIKQRLRSKVPCSFRYTMLLWFKSDFYSNHFQSTTSLYHIPLPGESRRVLNCMKYFNTLKTNWWPHTAAKIRKILFLCTSLVPKWAQRLSPKTQTYSGCGSWLLSLLCFLQGPSGWTMSTAPLQATLAACSSNGWGVTDCKHTEDVGGVQWEKNSWSKFDTMVNNIEASHVLFVFSTEA